MTGIAPLSALEKADTVIVPNRPDTSTPHHSDVLSAIARAHERGARMIGMCSRAFTLAEAGVLDGRRVTVHWQWADEFRARYPRVCVDDAVLFVEDGDILTSAGSAAALDLALHVVRRDHGSEVGAAVARRLVFPGHRPGGQRQFIERPLPKDTRSPLAEALVWAEEHATEPILVADIASRAAMSPANLHRRFWNELGCTPIQWLTTVRVEHARRLLEQTDLAVEQVAHRSGLGSAVNLRNRLADQTGLTPTAYRRAFASRDAAPGPSPRHLRGDDLAVAEDGVLFITNHIHNAVIRCDPRSGERVAIARPDHQRRHRDADARHRPGSQTGPPRRRDIRVRRWRSATTKVEPRDRRSAVCSDGRDQSRRHRWHPTTGVWFSEFSEPYNFLVAAAVSAYNVVPRSDLLSMAGHKPG